jgi:hypothetical protein
VLLLLGGDGRLPPAQAGLAVPPGGAGQADALLAADADGDLVQEAGHTGGPDQAGGAVSQDQEAGLEGVLGVVMVADDAPADAQHQRPVTADEAGEGVLWRSVS